MEAQTVLGRISTSDLGITLTHEHILLDATTWFVKAKSSELRTLAERPVKLEDLGELRWDPLISKDNLRHLKVSESLEEARFFKQAGGSTIVDCTTIGLSRNVVALKKISQSLGLNVIAGTGFYLDASHPKYVSHMSIDQLSTLMIDEVKKGVGKTGIKCGIIGEIGTGWPITKNEEKVLRAAARAQRETGAPLNIHPYPFEKHAEKILDILRKEDQDLSRVVLSHMDCYGYYPEYLASIAEQGCYVELDTFGAETYYENKGYKEPADFERVAEICELIKNGYISKILLSHDVTYKIQLRRYGGYGFDHILRHVVPMLRKAGVSEGQINTMIVENPKQMLAIHP